MTCVTYSFSFAIKWGYNDIFSFAKYGYLMFPVIELVSSGLWWSGIGIYGIRHDQIDGKILSIV